MEEHIQYDFLFDNHFNELKQQELMLQRVNLATQMDPFVGKYFSTEYVRRQVLMQTEKEFKELNKQMKKDIDSGLALDPVDINSMDMMSQQNTALQPELDAAKAEADFEKQKQLAAQKPKTSSSNK